VLAELFAATPQHDASHRAAADPLGAAQQIHFRRLSAAALVPGVGEQVG